MTAPCRSGLWQFHSEQAAADHRRAVRAHGRIHRCELCGWWHWRRREAPRPVIA